MFMLSDLKEDDLNAAAQLLSQESIRTRRKMDENEVSWKANDLFGLCTRGVGNRLYARYLMAMSDARGW